MGESQAHGHPRIKLTLGCVRKPLGKLDKNLESQAAHPDSHPFRPLSCYVLQMEENYESGVCDVEAQRGPQSGVRREKGPAFCSSGLTLTI